VIEGQEESVDGQLHHVVDHSWDQRTEVQGRLGQTGISVDFDEPHIEVFVYHEVVPK